MITYIVPSYNQGDYIKYTLDSIVANMGSEDHLIIADGASRDSTAAVVAPYLVDPRIEWFSEPDRGFSDAVGKALKRVRSPLIGIMSSDDAYMPGVRARVLPLFDDPEVLLIYGDYEIIDTENRKIGEHRHISGDLSDVLSLRVILPQSSVFFRRSALEGRAILNLAHDYVADVVLFNQVCLAGKFLRVPEIWSQVRKHAGSRSGRCDPGLQYLDALQTALVGMPEAIKDKARAGALLLRSRHLATSTLRLKSLGSMIEAFRLDPTLINHWLLPRTLAFLLLGAKGIGILQRMRGLGWSASRTLRHTPTDSGPA